MTEKRSAILILAFCVLLNGAGSVYGQNKIRFGISAEGIAKVYPVKYYRPLAATQVSGTFRIENEQPNALGLWLSFGFLLDPARYILKSESTQAGKVFIGLTQRNLSFSGLIVFPTRKENVQILAGIGMDYNLETSASYNWRVTNGINTIHQGMGLDSIQVLIEANRRKLLPSASIGLQYKIPGSDKLKVYCVFRQNFINSFIMDIPVYSISTGKNEQPATNYKPSYLKLGLGYDF